MGLQRGRGAPGGGRQSGVSAFCGRAFCREAQICFCGEERCLKIIAKRIDEVLSSLKSAERLNLPEAGSGHTVADAVRQLNAVGVEAAPLHEALQLIKIVGGIGRTGPRRSVMY